MITHEKRKNSDKWFMSYVNVAVAILIIGAFAALNIKVSQFDHTEHEVQLDSSAIVVDISGEWVGTMTEDYNDDVRYDYRVVFDQYRSNLEGFTFQESTNYSIDIYAESDITGAVSGTDVSFYEEVTLVLDNVSFDRWCRIAVNLNYQVIDGQETLIGSWNGAEDRIGCNTIEGRVVLTRQTD